MCHSDFESSKNYYQILGLDQNADEKKIKTAYRRLALTYHPDKNLGDKIALEKFKKITEAYGVLIDPVKRKDYDHYLSNLERLNKIKMGFGNHRYRDILNDIFSNPKAREVFEQMARGGSISMDEGFLRKILAGGFLFGGVFYGFWGLSPFGLHTKSDKIHLGDTQIRLFHILCSMRDRFKSVFVKSVRQVKGFWDAIGTKSEIEDKRLPIYQLDITDKEAIQGTTRVIRIKTYEGIRKYSIKIPAGIKDGVNLKIKDQNLEPYYIQINILKK